VYRLEYSQASILMVPSKKYK